MVGYTVCGALCTVFGRRTTRRRLVTSLQRCQLFAQQRRTPYKLRRQAPPLPSPLDPATPRDPVFELRLYWHVMTASNAYRATGLLGIAHTRSPPQTPSSEMRRARLGLAVVRSNE